MSVCVCVCMCVLRAREGWQGKTRRPCSQKGVHGNKVSRISIPPPFPPLHLLQTGRLVRIKLMVWSTYLLYGPSAAAAATAAAPLGSLLAYFLTGTECNTIRGWHFPRRYTHMHPLTLSHTHTHTHIHIHTPDGCLPGRSGTSKHHHRQVSSEM